jgi:23S rRNA (cytosine1962-C5)-methyltransferase
VPAGSRHPPAPSLPHALAVAIERRRGLIGPGLEAFRAFSGAADGVDGVFVDVYGPGATLAFYEGRAPRVMRTDAAAADVLSALSLLGVRSVYVKPFAKDRSRLGGELPEETTRATPAAGETLPEAVVIAEHRWRLEVRLYDGLSTGLFLDQRDNRGWVRRWVAERGGKASVLNTFAYTCAFSVAAAVAGAATTSVDVSPRYLDWGKRNFAHNGLEAASHRFARMDTFEFFGYAKRKGLRYDLVVLDPPSFSAGSKKKGIPAWSSVSDYARLVGEAVALVNRGGAVFASTNTQELCRDGRLEREIVRGMGRRPRWLTLPPVPADFARDRERFAARAFAVD